MCVHAGAAEREREMYRFCIDCLLVHIYAYINVVSVCVLYIHAYITVYASKGV